MNIKEITPATAPTGITVETDPFPDPQKDKYLRLASPEQIRQYYHDNGYVVIRNLISQTLCEEVRTTFITDVRSYTGKLYRQASAKPETHVLTTHGYMLNALMNIQDMEESKFSRFRKLALSVLTHPNLRKVVNGIMGRESIMAQSMYFEGNPSTWPHLDKDYLNSSEEGSMVGAWIALEDIQPGAGRFYVYPKSHRCQIENDSNIVLNRHIYERTIVEVLNANQLSCYAPALRKGDVLFWHGSTIHGSLPTTDPQYSRSSFTGHYIPVNSALLQYNSIKKKLNLRHENSMLVNFPKDQNVLKNKIVFMLETRMPKVFNFAKKKAIKLMVNK